MMPISTKLTLMVLVLPVFSMVFVFVVGFYFYRASFDASAFSTAVSSLLSALLVILLVWERLRDSLFKKLEYLHKNFLFKLLSDFRRGNLFWTQDEIKRLRVDLEKYGKFMNLSLYPNGLLKRVDEFLSLHAEFYRRLKEIEGFAEKQYGKAQLHRDLIWDYVGLKPDYVSDYTAEVKEQYKETVQNIVNEHPQLVSETKDFLEKIKSLEKQIFDKLEDFLKSNNLRLEEEASSTRW